MAKLPDHITFQPNPGCLISHAPTGRPLLNSPPKLMGTLTINILSFSEVREWLVSMVNTGQPLEPVERATLILRDLEIELSCISADGSEVTLEIKSHRLPEVLP